MDDRSWEAAAGLVDRTYVEQARQVAQSRMVPVRTLLESRKLPEQGWREADIEAFLAHCASMDSNNFSNNVGVGEREARVVSRLVQRRHFGLAHGVGRSGDIAAVQPKAAGSSLLAKLCNCLALDALREAGLKEMNAALVLPCATGLSLALCLLAMRQKCVETAAEDDALADADKRVVLWLRIDQKSCFKAIALAGLTPDVVEPTRSRTRGSAPRDILTKKEKVALKKEAAAVPAAPAFEEEYGDELLTDIGALEDRLAYHGGRRVLCIVTTASCFAPRAPDDVEAVARLCAREGVMHLVNNAYGVQCAATCARMSRAQRVGRVDLVVQSTDKNFLVPVGGAVISSGDAKIVAAVGKAYPGRASATPALDLIITFLELGRAGWRQLLDGREAMRDGFSGTLRAVAEKHGERLLACEHNRISFGVSLERIAKLAADAVEAGGGADGKADAAVADAVTKFGSMLFTRCVSGTRVVAPGVRSTISGVVFDGWGTSSSSYPAPYLTVACALGVAQVELDEFAQRLDRAFAQFHKQLAKAAEKQRAAAAAPADGAAPDGAAPAP
ncbi:pyridoxal phosphate-dependent transferase [Pelagophyceae sp. CCMP2097]|nr:pyridoxal phosphate-dependent transferase [Pelagophyceae sp. CCMP2097]